MSDFVTPDFVSPRPVEQSQKPAYLLLCEAKPVAEEGFAEQFGAWKFTLESLSGGPRLEAGDVEPAGMNRLSLLAVVRGLEALDQPSNVRLLTQSDYVGRGLRRHLADWRDNGFRWERFENLAPVKNHDLWRRIDRALEFHDVHCRVWRMDPPHATNASQAVPAPHFGGRSQRKRLILRRNEENSATLDTAASQA